MVRLMNGYEMADFEMISYAHKDAPGGVRFCQYRKDKIPVWAIDVQPYVPPDDDELPGMLENADFMGGETDA